MIRLLFFCSLSLLMACGPSLQRAHERTEFYERCYAADFDPTLSAEARRQCWSDWLRLHARNQPPERITFARQRLRELESETSPRVLPDEVPKPVEKLVHAYPPAPPGDYHTSGCDPLCTRRWHDCTAHCELDDKPCKAACESEFRICREGCP